MHYVHVKKGTTIAPSPTWSRVYSNDAPLFSNLWGEVALTCHPEWDTWFRNGSVGGDLSGKLRLTVLVEAVPAMGSREESWVSRALTRHAQRQAGN